MHCISVFKCDVFVYFPWCDMDRYGSRESKNSRDSRQSRNSKQIDIKKVKSGININLKFVLEIELLVFFVLLHNKNIVFLWIIMIFVNFMELVKMFQPHEDSDSSSSDDHHKAHIEKRMRLKRQSTFKELRQFTNQVLDHRRIP